MAKRKYQEKRERANAKKHEKKEAVFIEHEKAVVGYLSNYPQKSANDESFTEMNTETHDDFFEEDTETRWLKVLIGFIVLGVVGVGVYYMTM